VRKVKTRWSVLLPDNSTAKVKLGDEVSVGQILIEEKIVKEVVFNSKMPVGEMKGQTIKEGEVIFQTGGIFSKKVISPVSGTIMRIDEFNNIYVAIGGDDLKVIKSPLKAKVATIDNEKIELEYRAYEYDGVGLTDGKVWASKGIKKVSNLIDLTASDSGKVILVESIANDVLIKAEVIGVAGVIVIGGGSSQVKSKLPIIRLEADDEEFILRELNVERSIMLNAGNGRLLLVI